MSTPVMRAKVRVGTITQNQNVGGEVYSERIQFHGVAKKDGYDESGLDEDNTFAKFSPSVGVDITVTNPALLGKLKQGEAYYLDFTLADA